MAAGSYLLKINALLLLVLFTYIILKPVFPYLEYMARKDFIIENLCINKSETEKQCDGLCHLEKQLKKEVEGPENSNLPPAPQNEKEELPDFVINKLVDKSFLQVKALAGSAYQGRYTFQYVPSIFHPPMPG